MEYGQKGGGGRRAEAQWYHVRCYTLGGANAPPPLKYGPGSGTTLGDRGLGVVLGSLGAVVTMALVRDGWIMPKNLPITVCFLALP